METPDHKITLESLPTGSRLVIRSRTDWRFAAISKVIDGGATLTVCSPTGRTYSLRRKLDTVLNMKDTVPVLFHDCSDDWRENFTRCDRRW